MTMSKKTMSPRSGKKIPPGSHLEELAEDDYVDPAERRDINDGTEHQARDGSNLRTMAEAEAEDAGDGTTRGEEDGDGTTRGKEVGDAREPQHAASDPPQSPTSSSRSMREARAGAKKQPSSSRRTQPEEARP